MYRKVCRFINSLLEIPMDYARCFKGRVSTLLTKCIKLHMVLNNLLKSIELGLIQEILLDDDKARVVMPSTRTLTANQRPLTVNQIENFDSVAQQKKKYVQRVRGFFKAPETGEYKFYSSCSGPCEVSIGQEPSLKPRTIISQKEESLHNEFNR